MTKDKMNYALLFISLIIKFMISLMIITPDISFIYTMIIGTLAYLLIKYKFKTYNHILLVISDFLISFLLCVYFLGSSFQTIILCVNYFLISNGVLYYILISDISVKTSYKLTRKSSNMAVDEGIKALEKKDYDKAIDCFISAIKNNKQNYLGYMGMCNTLNKLDKKKLKKINYYKKKCIKYAPNELKENIRKKY